MNCSVTLISNFVDDIQREQHKGPRMEFIMIEEALVKALTATTCQCIQKDTCIMDFTLSSKTSASAVKIALVHFAAEMVWTTVKTHSSRKQIQG